MEAHEITQMPLVLTPDLSFMTLYITASDSLHVAQDVTTNTDTPTHTNRHSGIDMRVCTHTVTL